MSDKELQQNDDATTTNKDEEPSKQETGSEQTASEELVPEEKVEESSDKQKEDSEDAGEAATEETAEEETKPKKSHLLQVLVILAGLGLVTFLTTTGLVNVQNNNSASSLSAGEPVAMVNGVEISQNQYDQQVQQAEAFMQTMGGEQASDPTFQDELRGRILDDLVNAEILYQKAIEEGFEASEEEVDAEFEATKAQIGDEELFESQLSTIGLTPDTLKETLKKQITIEAYISSNTNPENVEIAQEEVQALYDQFFAGQEGAPTLEEVQPQIEAELQNQAVQQQVSDLIDQLRAEAEIEILI